MTKVFLSSLILCCLILSGCQKDGKTDVATAAKSTAAPTAEPSNKMTPEMEAELRREIASTPVAVETSVVVASKEGKSFVPSGYKKVWSDEFNYEGLPDTTKWGYQTGGYGWTAKELQNYMKADPDNVGVKNGVLRISALKELTRRNMYTSTRLVSKGKANFTRGYFEVRAQLPHGDGLRSTFWMVGDTVSQMGWPNAGEINLFEHYGKFPTVVNAAVQNVDNNWPKGNQMGSSKIVKTMETDFHVYSCEWTETELKFAVDGEIYWTYQQPPGRGWRGYPYRWPFYMVANLSVGGVRGPQSPVDEAVLPASMWLDYVRVYQK